ncbi:MAG: Ig-like domain repeat protein, partial [Acidobacteriaceae bacterium]|nr:Ig-like domain repeat protein [Acidobacteriaceae bacterium]
MFRKANVTLCCIFVFAMVSFLAASKAYAAVTAQVTGASSGYTPTGVDFDGIEVTQQSVPITVTFTFNAPATVSNAEVTGQGGQLVDFIPVPPSGMGTPTDTCTGAVITAADQTCSVEAIFAPTATGLREGAITLFDALGNQLGVAYLKGLGLGPQLVFRPATMTHVAGAGTTDTNTKLVQGKNMVMDAAGNLYVANLNSCSVSIYLYSSATDSYSWSQNLDVSEGTCTGNAAGTSGTYTGSPRGMWVDGAGNIYVVNSDTGVVWEFRITSLPGVYPATYHKVQLSATGTPALLFAGVTAKYTTPSSIVVDGYGNIFFTESQANPNNVWKAVLKPDGTYTLTAIWSISPGGNGATNTNAWGLAVDAAGNVYVGLDNTFRVVKLIPADSTNPPGETLYNVSTGGDVANASNGGLAGPYSLAVDAAGDVYIADTTGGTGSCTAQYNDTTGANSCNGTSQVVVAVPQSQNDPNTTYKAAALPLQWPDGTYNTTFPLTTTGAGTMMRNGSSLRGIAIDKWGNLYVMDQIINANSNGVTLGTIWKLTMNVPPSSLEFGKLYVGNSSLPQVFSPTNIGNENLTIEAADTAISPITDGGAVNNGMVNFATGSVLSSGGSTACIPDATATPPLNSVDVLPATSCDLTVSFSPVANTGAGVDRAVLNNLDTNTLNATADPIAKIDLNGIGLYLCIDPPGCVDTPVSPYVLSPGLPNVPYSGLATPFTPMDGSSGNLTAPLSITDTANPGTYLFSGTLPPGMQLWDYGGGRVMLSGTATSTGTYDFTLQAKDSTLPVDGGPYTTTQAYTLTISNVVITTPSPLLDATYGATYSQTLGANGGTGPYTYAVTSGSLPPGLILSAAGVTAGVISGQPGASSGSPATVGSYSFAVTVTDSKGATGTQTYVLTVQPATVRVVAFCSRVYGTALSLTNNCAYSINGIVTTVTNSSGTTYTGDTFIGTVTVDPAGALLTSPVGTYPLTPGANPFGNTRAANYNVVASTPVGAYTNLLTITPAPLVVTANPATFDYGQPYTGLTAQITSPARLPNGDSFTVGATTALPPNSLAATYTGAIVPTLTPNGTTLLSNYDVTYNNADLTIEDLVVTSTVTVNAPGGTPGPSAAVPYGTPVTLTDAITPAPAVGDTGTVTFYEVPAGTASCSSIPAGSIVIGPAVNVSSDGTSASATLPVALPANPDPYLICAAYSGSTTTGQATGGSSLGGPVSVTVTPYSLSPGACLSPIQPQNVCPALILTPNPATRLTGDPDSSIAWSYTTAIAPGASLQNGDTLATVQIAGNPGTFTPDYTSGSSTTEGVYPVALSGLTSSNYVISFAPGTLTLNDSPTNPTLKIGTNGNPPSTATNQQTSYGQTVVLQTTVPASGSGSAPTGTVTFYDSNGNPICAAPVLSDGTATCDSAPGQLPAGMEQITSVYSGDSNYAPGTAGPMPLQINPATANNDGTTPAIVITVANTSMLQGSATMPAFSYTCALATGAQFYNGDTCAAIVDGIAKYFVDPTVDSTTPLSGTQPSISIADSATGSTACADTSTTSPGTGCSLTVANYTVHFVPGTLTIVSAATLTTMTVTPTTALTANGGTTYGVPVTLTAQVTEADGTTPVPAGGTVTFSNGGVVLCTATVQADGSATCEPLNGTDNPLLPVGSYDVTATYQGDGTTGSTDMATSTSLPVPVTVTRAKLSENDTTPVAPSAPPPATSATQGTDGPDGQPYPAPYLAVVPGTTPDDPATITAGPFPTSTTGGPATGTVTITDSLGNPVCSATINTVTGTASCQAILPPGTTTLDGNYSGDPNFSPSTVGPPVAVPVSLSLTVNGSTNPSPTTYGQSVVLTTTVPPGTTASQLAFNYDVSGTATPVPGCTVTIDITANPNTASCTTTTMPVGGPFDITANLTGASPQPDAASNTVQLTVNAAEMVPVLASVPDPPTAGQAGTVLTVTLPSDATGTVTFYEQDGTTALPGCTNRPITAGTPNATSTCTVTIPVGTTAVEAKYNTGGNYAPATTNQVPVNAAEMVPVLASVPDPPTAGQAGTVLTVTLPS